MRILSRWMNDLKVKYKLAVIYFIVGFIPIVVIFLFCYGQIKNILIEKETDSINSFVGEAVVNMENKMRMFENVSQYIIFNSSVSQVIQNDSESLYNRYLELNNTFEPFFDSVRICHDKSIKDIKLYVDIEDIVSKTLAPIDEIVNEKWYPSVSDSAINYWYVDHDKNEVLLISHMASLEKNTKLKGILVIKLDYKDIFQSFEEAQRNNYGIFITDKDESMIYSSAQFEEKYKKYEVMSYKRLKQLSKNDYMIVNKSSQISNISTKWNICLYKPQEFVVSSFDPIVKSSIFSISFCIIACFIGLFVTSKFITKPIEILNRNMQEVDDGHIQTEISSDAKDELGSLIRTFGKMIGRIKVLIDEVYDSRIAQKNYEMRALQAQINPHFLYNSLSLINWKAIEAEQEDISKITLALSSFYRTSLNKGKNTLRLGEEISNMSSYLEIQEVMHDNSFDVIIDIEDEMKDNESLNLILQPIVENAIEHGIDLVEDVRGCISVTGWCANDIMNILVEDNGKGMSKEKAETILTIESKGYGVRNVDERIKMYYGSEYGLRIDSTPGKGTKVFVTFPAVKKKG